jgi:hypothetical protein
MLLRCCGRFFNYLLRCLRTATTGYDQTLLFMMCGGMAPPVEDTWPMLRRDAEPGPPLPEPTGGCAAVAAAEAILHEHWLARRA